MKKILTILTLFAALTLASSCQKELPDEFKDLVVNKGEQEQTPTTTPEANYLRVSTESLSFTAAGGSITFTISSNTSWSVSSNQSWCTVSPSSGSDNGSITVNVTENQSTDSRSATITVKAGDITQNISVTQDGATPVDQSSRTFTVNGVSFKMILVDGGIFTMGATPEQGDDADEWEKPTHSVTLSTYYIGETEVTQELWQTVMGSTPSHFSGTQKPVEQVSWYDCQDFITRLNSLTGENFRLPTEAEWEFAARGGKKSQGYKYSGSNTIGDVAWYSDNSNSETHNVAQKSPNELGLYDMSGNVWEWCLDWHGWYSSSSQTNPMGPSSGTDRVFRGGSWSGSAWDSRVSRRTSHAFWLDYEGLRLALPTVESNKTLTVDKNNLSFTSFEGSDTFIISSNTNWSITSDQSWCTVNPFSGYYNETITVKVTENQSTDSRSATITVNAGDLSQTISVTQAGATPPDQGIKTFTVNGVSFKMIRVDGGTFNMGATSEQGNDVYDNEKPAHSVTLSTYYIGETEVTQELWQAVMGSNPSGFSGSQRPVEQVSWNDCQDFVTRLNSLTGENFRLPTEAEWEFAARGGNNSRGYKYSGSNTIDDVAWYSDNSNNETHKVAQKSPNELGLYDMSGNVWEWCMDWYGDYISSSQTNPTGPSSGSFHVFHGGSWFDRAWCCRVSYRNYSTPDGLDSHVGLRLVL